MPEPKPTYDVEALMKKWPKVRATRLESMDNPTLEELLAFGPLEALADALICNQIPHPWSEIVYTRIPTAVMVLAAAKHIIEAR